MLLRILLLTCVLPGVFSCSRRPAQVYAPAETLPAVAAPDPALLELCEQLVGADSSRRVYHLLQAGELMMESEKFVRITRQQEHFTHEEVYNVYRNAAGVSEYFLSRYTVPVQDAGEAFHSEDFRAGRGRDTAYVYASGESEFELKAIHQLEVQGKRYPVYELVSYGHNHGEHGHDGEHAAHKPAKKKMRTPTATRFWTPGLGAVLVRYPDAITEALHDAGSEAKNRLAAAMLAKLPELAQPK